MDTVEELRDYYEHFKAQLLSDMLNFSLKDDDIMRVARFETPLKNTAYHPIELYYMPNEEDDILTKAVDILDKSNYSEEQWMELVQTDEEERKRYLQLVPSIERMTLRTMKDELLNWEKVLKNSFD